ncbi:MAG: hypothetical protein FWF67_08245 [Fibromonadales bacterium]|nr:hypothetical protein [Fibromonadales bacterium]
MTTKSSLFFVFVLCCSIFAQSKPTAVQYQETQKQYDTWRTIKGNFSNKNDFFNLSKQGFEAYFKKYSPQFVSKDEKSLIMTAKYGKYNIKCIFFVDANSQYIVAIETDFDRDKIKWINNVVKQVEKLEKK